MYKVFNNVEGYHVFEGDKAQLISFSKMIREENGDEKVSIRGFATAVVYLERYCDNLDLHVCDDFDVHAANNDAECFYSRPTLEKCNSCIYND